jgi:NADH dehydrogenase [ubiquinone] 1 alpha subcomplex assembly factor 7
MRSVQRQKLLPLLQTDKWDLFWHDSIDDVPRVSGLFTLLFAHEFFDALPVHLLEVTYVAVCFLPWQ